MSDLNSIQPASNSTKAEQTSLCSIQFISSGIDFLRQTCKHCGLLPLVKHAVEVVGEMVEPIVNMMLEQDICNLTEITLDSAVDVYSKSRFSVEQKNMINIAKALTIAGIHVGIGGKHPVMFLTLATKPCIDAALSYLKKHFANVEKFWNENKAVLDITTTLVIYASNSMLSVAAGTWPMVGKVLTKISMNAVLKNIYSAAGNKISLFARMCGYAGLNSLFYSDVSKLFTKILAKTTAEVCKLINAPTKLTSSSDAPMDGAKEQPAILHEK